MKWSFRWYGKDDNIPIEHIRQIPQMHGVVGTLLNKLPGDVWEIEEIEALKKQVNDAGLELHGIESVSVHDAIKAGTAERDQYIENYIQTIRNLGQCGVKVICYSFKPVFGWLKTDLNYQFEDGSYGLVFDQSVIDGMEPTEVFNHVQKQTGGFKLSGWEKERLDKFERLTKMYEGITEEQLFENYKYFIESIIDACEEADVYLAVHQDDPPWEIFGWPRITKNAEDLRRILSITDSKHHGLTICTGSLGADPNNDIPAIIREMGDRINFVHFRNVRYLGEKHFAEVAHYSPEGDLDMAEIMKALVEVGYEGIIRPDHGRAIWGEVCRPGYGLYDRAIGIGYMQGLYEMCKKQLAE